MCVCLCVHIQPSVKTASRGLSGPSEENEGDMRRKEALPSRPAERSVRQRRTAGAWWPASFDSLTLLFQQQHLGRLPAKTAGVLQP